MDERPTSRTVFHVLAVVIKTEIAFSACAAKKNRMVFFQHPAKKATKIWMFTIPMKKIG